MDEINKTIPFDIDQIVLIKDIGIKGEIKSFHLGDFSMQISVNYKFQGMSRQGLFYEQEIEAIK